MNLWWSLVDRPIFALQNLNQEWDVAIVGGGFSGLWTAHHLLESIPTLKIAIFEMDKIGTGASGRNGGWVSALYPKSDGELSKNFSVQQISDLHNQLESAIDEIGAFAAKEKIECGFHKGGTMTIATNVGQLQRLQGDPGYLDREDTISRISMRSAVGSTYSPHCAAFNPAAFICGLASSLVTRGVAIFEDHAAIITANRALLVRGEAISAKFVVRAVEAYLVNTRLQIPVYSLVVATDPLSEETREIIGIRNRETFAQASHLVTYAQLTSDNRLVIGGRGAPYSWASRRSDRLESRAKDHARLRSMAMRWFPILKESDFSHAWGGAVGITRDWSPYVRFESNYGEMGGYVGDGVSLSYLAGAAMADCILGNESSRSRLPFVQWKNREWEREPWRWVATNLAITATFLADREEQLTQKPSRIAKSLSFLLKR